MLLLVTERRILGAASQSYRGFVETVERGKRLGAEPEGPGLLSPIRTPDAEVLGIGERPVEVAEGRLRIPGAKRLPAEFDLGPREELPHGGVALPEVDLGGLQHADGLSEPAGGVECPGEFDRGVVAAAGVCRHHLKGLHGVRRPSFVEQQPGQVPVEGLVRGPSFDRLSQAVFGLRRPARDLPVDHPERPVGGREFGIQRGRRLPGGDRLLVAAKAAEQVSQEQTGGSRGRESL